ncbi:PASTA domain-containing protein [Arthrobacter alpinus]|uniref:PASTA domain-containing protein n=1 Tax=Arthrobacter alpinus TaxID=656366 RepID=UPI001644EF16|nr:PASTA domain-containing protein [Arthrobacter alpinus]
MKKTITATILLAVGLALSGCGEAATTAAQTSSPVTTSPASQAKLDNYVGKNLKETRKLLEAAGVKVTAKGANDKTILAESNWTVTAQDPAAGQSSNTITLTATKPEATPAVTQASPEPPQSKPEEKLKVEDSTCNIDENFGKCFFGQTAIYEDSRRSRNQVLLEITVQEPQEFNPGNDADFAIKTLGGTQEKGPDNLYFDIVIKNLSGEEILGRSDIELVANSATDGDFDVRSVQDDNVEHYWDANLEPGQSATMRSGWNFNDASRPTFKVSIDGLGGNSVTFSQK